MISSIAAKEAKRLSGQSFPVYPLKLREAGIGAVSEIDGAILMDDSGNCHALGVILDGQASHAGDPSRGARYNSAVRYVEQTRNKKASCLIVIVSEDGMVNLTGTQ